tara:strand:- start:34 stop:405 length:372 start_codon:yes stop_codon:yes gene_type:complete
VIIKSEKDVRAAIKRIMKGPVFWVEAAAGGTRGFPDCVVAQHGFPVFCELKVGVMKKDHLSFTVRPAQRKVLLSMAKAGFKVRVMVGLKGASVIYDFAAVPLTLSGRVPIGLCISAGIYLSSG